MTSESTTIENRSEIVFLYDALDANPNGNPLSGANRPRIDPHTQQAIVTDVRLKRYLRDQLTDDGHGVYIRNVQEDGTQYTRERLLEDRLKAIDVDEVPEDDLSDEVFGEFLANSVDVRYFGATMSVDTDNEYAKHLPDHFTGPVQFSPGKSMHSVIENEEYNSLTSVIATQEGKEQGGFGLDDHRIQYGLIRFHGLVDEHGAADTNLTPTDVARLDTLCWRSIKNQTISRSKVGQEPRLYLRVEYNTESFHLGGLAYDLTLDETGGRTKPDSELRTIRDLTVSIDGLVERLRTNRDRVECVHVVASDVLPVSYEDDVGDGSLLYDALTDALGSERVHVVDVYGEYPETLPE